MRIFLKGINFAPELTGIGNYTDEIARWLVKAVNEVRVITTPPYCSGWKVGVGYSAGRYTRESGQGISVWRTPLLVPHKPGGLQRLLHPFNFALLPRHTARRQRRNPAVSASIFAEPAQLLRNVFVTERH